jgi:hypothetical protein
MERKEELKLLPKTRRINYGVVEMEEPRRGKLH